ncbi:MAG: chromate transporter [Gemmiger sp.]
MLSPVNGRLTYRKLFFSTFQISACTFGGGFVIIPLLRKKFVEELGWIDENEMLDLIAIAQSAPGAIAVNASLLVGYRVAGFPGALLTVSGTVLPPLLIISLVSVFYQAFRDNALVSMAMAGMLCGVAAVICDVVLNMAKTVFQKKRLLPVVMMLGALIAVRWFAVNILLILLVCGGIGAADTWYHGKKKKAGDG